jgi:predicted nucleic acid-binding protein
MAIAVIDTNVLVGLLDEHDKWHDTAIAIRDALAGVGAELVYFDCVLNEAISVLARRTAEQRRPDQFTALLDQLAKLIPVGDIAWASGEIQRLYDQVLGLVRNSAGKLNFHDALIALICREQGIPVLISFDRDFDQIDWLIRVDSAAEVVRALQ